MKSDGMLYTFLLMRSVSNELLYVIIRDNRHTYYITFFKMYLLHTKVIVTRFESPRKASESKLSLKKWKK